MRLVLIGVSHWHAQFHGRGFALAGAEIVGASDPNPSAAEKIAHEFGAKAYQDFEHMLGQESPDFAVVMGTPLEMPHYARHLIEIGMPFAIEKPIGINASIIQPLLELAGRKNLFVAVPFANRYSGVWEALSSSKISHMHFCMINGSPARYERDGVGWVLEPEVSGGGVLRNLGIHGVDAFCAMAAGEPIEVVSSVLSSRMHTRKVEDFASLVLRAPSGLIGTIEAGNTFSTMAAGGDYGFRIAAEGAYILEQGDTLRVIRNGNSQELPTEPTATRYDAFARDVVERLQKGLPPLAGLEDCYRAMEIIDRAYAQAVWA